jgi:arginine:ornithine antiporter/lysine permease
MRCGNDHFQLAGHPLERCRLGKELYMVDSTSNVHLGKQAEPGKQTQVAASSDKLKIGALIALVVGSMVGGGIFSLPQNIAASASAGATLIGWLITGVGMLMLAFVFQTLANRKPKLDGGVYAYAKAGCGDYMGFSSAWGYWISAWIGNVSYMVLLFSTLGFFFPMFGEGNTLPAMACASVLLWFLHFLVLRGIKEAAFINTLTTIAKMVPLALFIVIAAVAFKLDVFTSDFWGAGNSDLGTVMNQVRSMMLVTVWVFIGIEGASIFSARAEKRSDVGKATVVGFIAVLLLLVLVNVLSQGILAQAQLSGLKNPSMAGVLESVVGHWGAVLISVGLIVSLAGALLSWTLLCAEILFASARDHTMPEFLRKENANQVPANALWLSNGLIQLFLIITLFNSSTYLSLLYLATSMILVPYFWSAAYALLLAFRHETYEQAPGERTKDLVIALIAVLYAVWLVYAAGVQYLLLSALLYAPGAILFAKAKRELGQPVFTTVEKMIFAVVLIGALIAGYGLYSGFLSL